MSWKFVFNSNNIGAGKTLEQITTIAMRIGYEFFTFNGKVYFTTNGASYETLLTINDLF